MDKVYEIVYKSFISDSKNVDHFDFGQENPFAQLSSYCGWMYNICRGFVQSDGWEMLKNYPDDFKVVYAIYTSKSFDLICHLLVRSGHTRLSEWNLLAVVLGKVQLPTTDSFYSVWRL